MLTHHVSTRKLGALDLSGVNIGNISVPNSMLTHPGSTQEHVSIGETQCHIRGKCKVYARPISIIVPADIFTTSIAAMKEGILAHPFPHLSTNYQENNIPVPSFIEIPPLLACNHPMAKGDDLTRCVDCGVTSVINGEQLLQEKTWIKEIWKDDANTCPTPESHVDMLHGCGVTVEWLLAFTFDHDCWKKPTWWVNRHIIKEATRQMRCRYVDLPNMRAYAGAATVFISHCWSAEWGNVVHAACHGARQNRLVWIDLFAVRQWPGKGGPSTIGNDLCFRDTIKKCTALIISVTNVDGMEKPMASTAQEAFLACPLGQAATKKTPFFRLWCNVEISCAVFNQIPIVVKLASMVKMNQFVFSDTSHCGYLMSNLSAMIDVEKNSVTSRKTDYDREMNFIRNMPGNGINRMNKIIRGVCSGAQQTVGVDLLELDAATCGEWELLNNLNALILCNGTGGGTGGGNGPGESKSTVQRTEGPRRRSEEFGFAVKLLRAVAAGNHSIVLEKLWKTWAKMETVESLSIASSSTSSPWLCDVINTSCAIWGACTSGHVNVLKTLLSCEKVNVNVTNTEGSTALSAASESGHEEIVLLLLAQNNIDINQCDHLGRSPLDKARANGHDKIEQLLLKK